MRCPTRYFSRPTARLASLAAVVLSTLLLALAAPVADAAAQAPLTLRTPPQSARVYARDGSLLAELGPQARTIVSIRSLPPLLPKAFVAVEDRRFYEHSGVDPIGVARALKNTVQGDREGASTITQQLIGAMYPELVDRREISLERKAREAQLALQLEQRYGKERILEAYLNQIYFGHGWYGIEAAARHYFGKPAAKLALEEIAMLAALPKGAGVYSPKINPQRALERRNLVLDILVREGLVNAADAATAKQRPIRLAPNHGYAARPPYVIEQVRQFLQEKYGPKFGEQGLQVWTSIDPVAQNAADSALVKGLLRAEQQSWFRGPKFGTPAGAATAAGTPYLQGMVLSIDARTGEILAMVGGRDFEESKFNRATAARRQPGSSFKPIVYATALEHGIAPATVLQDTALRIEMAGSKPYEPKNSDNLFRGAVTLREALTASINTIAIQLGQEIDFDTVAAQAKRYGIQSPVQPYPSSMIGASVVRPIELVAAYTAFANRGLRVEPFLVRRVSDASGKVLLDQTARGYRTLSPEVAFLVTDLLKDAAEKGTGREARQRLPAAVPMAGKTGTTNDGTDVWYVGYTPEIVTGVWVGFDTPKSIGSAAYGSTLAAPIWGEMMRDIYQKRKAPATWAVPPTLLTVAVDEAGQPVFAPCPAAAARKEYYLAGTAPTGVCAQRAGGLPGDWAVSDSVSLEPLGGEVAPPDTVPVPPDSIVPPPRP